MHQVADAIRVAAQTEALPRFKNLQDGDIREKKPGDPVTVADLAMEEALRASLGAILPSAAFVGEESFETDPHSIDVIKDADAAWIVDPIDGTRNYAAGDPCFAVIVAFVSAGETVMGWIHDPVNNTMMTAEKGAGAHFKNKPLRPNLTPQSVGYVAKRLRERMSAIAAPAPWTATQPPLPLRLGCAGQEYMKLATGEALFARFGGQPKPWDHAAGTLILSESGGHHALTEPESGPYHPGRGVRPGTLLCAANKPTWETAHQWINAAD